jgi:hypothetical protein
VAALRYEVLVEEFGETLPGADHTTRLAPDPLDDSATLLALQARSGELIATLRLNLSAPTSIPSALQQSLLLERFKDFGPRALSYTSGLAIARASRSPAVLSLLIGAAYKLCRAQGVRFDFVAATPATLSIYDRLGYRRYADNAVDNGVLRVPMVLLTEDVRYLKDIESPLLRLALTENNPSDTAAWMVRAFPGAHHRGKAPGMGDDEFWAHLSKRLGGASIQGVPLLEGLTPAESKRFVASGTTLFLRQGESVIVAGTKGHEMYVLLAGEVDVCAPHDDRHVIARLGVGDVFGEVGYLSEVRRSASVIARSDVEALVLTQDYLKRIIASAPEIAAKVLFNLSLILCNRLPGAGR